MKTDTQFLKTTARFIVNQQMSQRKLSVCGITDLTVDIVMSLLAANSDEEPAVAQSGLIGHATHRMPAQLVPAVPIAESVHDDYIVCLEDGLRFQMLKRHLTETYGMSPDQYRRKWGLPLDYPMTAPAYSRRRGEIARERNLGRYSRR